MISNDYINAGFELISGFLNILNIMKLIKDKTVKGVSWIPTTFFTLWGFWNLYYYPSLNQYFSFIGGFCIAISNIIWLLLIIKYNAKEKKYWNNWNNQNPPWNIKKDKSEI